jgi:hypothetical protein
MRRGNDGANLSNVASVQHNGNHLCHTRESGNPKEIQKMAKKLKHFIFWVLKC